MIFSPGSNSKANSSVDLDIEMFNYNYFFIETCLALDKVGFFDLLRSKRKLEMSEVAKMLKVDLDLFSPCVEYVWAVSNILGKEDNKFYLKDENFSKRLWVLEAYKPVFCGLS